MGTVNKMLTTWTFQYIFSENQLGYWFNDAHVYIKYHNKVLYTDFSFSGNAQSYSDDMPTLDLCTNLSKLFKYNSNDTVKIQARSYKNNRSTTYLICSINEFQKLTINDAYKIITNGSISFEEFKDDMQLVEFAKCLVGFAHSLTKNNVDKHNEEVNFNRKRTKLHANELEELPFK